MKLSLTSTAIASLALASTANAAVSRNCPSDGTGICYSLNIPDETASSGSGDIFFQISAPTTFQWVGLGQGSGMAGANIFVIYTSSDGQNVTLSPRSGVGHVEPEHDSSDTAQVTLLAGSGIKDGKMTANVRCSNCNSWSGGTMDFRSSNAEWIHAAKSGSPLDSDDLDEGISFHDVYSPFTWDFTAARGGNDVNPFLTVTPMNTTTSTSSGDDDDEGTPPKDITKIMMAHGILASLVFVMLFPIGGILVRLLSFPGFVKVHIAIQFLGYTMWLAAFGLGVYMSDLYSYTSTRHPILGLVVFFLVLLQPIFGWLHHKMCKKTGRRNAWSFIHLSVGRIAIILGMINGGLGLSLAGNASRGAIIAYGVVAGVIGVTYLGVAMFGEVRRYNSRQDKIDGQIREEKGQNVGDRQDSRI